MRRSKTLAKLRNNEIVLCMNTSLHASAKLVEIAGMVGYDCAWLDTEHRDLTADKLGS